MAAMALKLQQQINNFPENKSVCLKVLEMFLNFLQISKSKCCDFHTKAKLFNLSYFLLL